MSHPNAKQILWCAILIAGSAVWALEVPPLPIQPLPQAVFNFDQDAPGKPPKGFDLLVAGGDAGVHWEIQTDRHAPSPPNVLAQTGRTQPGDQFAVALLQGPPMEYGEVAVHFKTTAGEENQAAGLVWRYQDPRNFYAVMASGKTETVTVYRVKKGRVQAIDSKDAIVSPLAWHELRLVFVKKNFTVFLDGELAAGNKDGGLRKAGRVGFGTQSDSHILFDDFRVSH